MALFSYQKLKKSVAEAVAEVNIEMKMTNVSIVEMAFIKILTIIE